MSTVMRDTIAGAEIALYHTVEILYLIFIECPSRIVSHHLTPLLCMNDG